MSSIISKYNLTKTILVVKSLQLKPDECYAYCNRQSCSLITGYMCKTCHWRKTQMCHSYHVCRNRQLFKRAFNILRTMCCYRHSTIDLLKTTQAALVYIEHVLRSIYEKIYIRTTDLSHEHYKIRAFNVVVSGLRIFFGPIVYTLYSFIICTSSAPLYITWIMFFD